MSIGENLAARNTRQGLKREVRLIGADCLFLGAGILGLTFGLPPLIYVAALGHLVVGVLVSPMRIGSLAITLPIQSVLFVLYSACFYAVQTQYFNRSADTIHAYIQDNWLLIFATASVVGGCLSMLFSHVGFADLIAEQQAGEN